MIIKKNEGLILTSKGIEQITYQTEKLTNAQQSILSIIENEHILDNLIKEIITKKYPVSVIEDLIKNSFIEVVPLEYLDEAKKLHIDAFSQIQNNEINSVDDELENDFNDEAFSKKNENLMGYLDVVDPKNITVLNDKNTLHQKSIITKDKNSYTDLDSLSALAPEKRGFDEIKNYLTLTIKKMFPIKSIIFNNQIKKIDNMSSLNDFLNKIFPEIEKKYGKESVEELINRVNTIKYNNNLT